MTNLGVTKRTWEDWVKREVDENEMRALTPAAVLNLYKHQYWNRLNCDLLPAGVDYAAFDCAVNMGVGTAARYLQEAVGVEADGQVGPKTIDACKRVSAAEIIDRMSDLRMAKYEALPTFPVFGKGWQRRVNEVETLAKTLADSPGSSA
jgi:lysozyme family protein